MRGISVKRINGQIVFVNVDDGHGNISFCPAQRYIDKGYEPDCETLPDEEDCKQ